MITEFIGLHYIVDIRSIEWKKIKIKIKIKHFLLHTKVCVQYIMYAQNTFNDYTQNILYLEIA